MDSKDELIAGLALHRLWGQRSVRFLRFWRNSFKGQSPSVFQEVWGLAQPGERCGFKTKILKGLS